MQNLAFELEAYLSETFGLSASMEPAPQDADKLPIFWGSLYSVCRAKFCGRPVALLIHDKGSSPSPAAVSKRFELVRNALGDDVAFVFPSLASFERKRLVQRRVPFIVPHQQTCLPDLLIDLRELVRSGGPRLPEGAASEHLPSPAQVLLLYYLQHGYTPSEKPHELYTLKLLTTPEQFEVITDAMLGEEGDHFIELIDHIKDVVKFPSFLPILISVSVCRKSRCGVI